MMKIKWIAMALIFLPFEASATELIFFAGEEQQQIGPNLAAAAQLANSCANVSVSFRVHQDPEDGNAELDADVSKLEAAGRTYYITAASVDYIASRPNSPPPVPMDLYWDSGAMCWNLLNRSGARGLYLHEVISARRGAFTDADWQMVEQYASCAKATGKKIIWNEWAGSEWGWQTFLNQTRQNPGYPRSVLNTYKDVFVFLWANNVDARDLSVRFNLQLSQASVGILGDASHPANPLGYSFPHGASIQDWHWLEMHKDSNGNTQGSPRETMPLSVIGGFGIVDYLHGGRYFQFERNWENERVLAGITELRNYIVKAENCSSP
jgi:hypothetical protein